MLKLLRKHRKGLFGGVILGLVSLTMIGFGLDFFGSGRGENSAIRVGEKEISSVEYYRRLTQTRDRYRNQFGAQYEQIAKMLNLEQQTVDQLINAELLQDLLASLNLSASPREVRARIESHPFFQGRPPTQESYRSLFRALGMTGARLEGITAQELANQTITSTLRDTNVFSDKELQAVYRDKNREASFHYVEFQPTGFKEKVTLDDKEALQSYYVDNAEKYRKPRAVKFNVVVFSPSQFAKEVEVTEEDMLETYEHNKTKFVNPKKVTFRRILFKKNSAEKSALEQMVTDQANSSDSNALKKKTANETLERIEAGDNFADLARELSEDESTKDDGGRVDWVEFRALKPEIRKALNNLEVGENSKVVTTDDGYYLLLVDGIQEKTYKKLEEVRAQVEQMFRMEYAPEYAQAAAENFHQLFKEESAKNSDIDLKAFAEINSQQIFIGDKLLSRGQAAPGASTIITETALGLNEGDSEILESGPETVVIQVSEIKPSYIPEYEEVKIRVEDDYRIQESTLLAKQTAEAALAKLKESDASKVGETLTQIAKEQGSEMKTSAAGSRTAIQDPVIAQPNIRQVAFTLSDTSRFAKELVESNGSYYLLALASEEVKKADDFEKSREELARGETQRAARRLEEVLIKQLRGETEIWVDPKLLDEASG